MSAIAKLETDVVSALGTFMSPMNARTLYQRAVRSACDEGDVAAIVGRMRSGVRLFVRAADVPRAEAALEALADGERSVRALTIELRTEGDLHAARCAVRDTAAALGARSLSSQKLLTVASELCRNVIMYTPGGTLDVIPSNGRPATVTLVCTDTGAGIANLDDVLAGRYRSKTGLGKGIAGVKKLMDTFEVSTGPNGTRIVTSAAVNGGFGS